MFDMTEPNDPLPPPADQDGELSIPPALPACVPPGDRWTKRKMADFLRALGATHSVAAAARSVGMSRQSAYKLRARLKGAPFDIAWETAFQHTYDALAQVALERALHGVEVPHYHRGELVGTSRHYDERLTVYLLSARNSKNAQMLSRYGAAGEFWSERWDRLLDRVEHGPADWTFDPELEEREKPDDEDRIGRALDHKYAPDPSPHERKGGVRGK